MLASNVRLGNAQNSYVRLIASLVFLISCALTGETQPTYNSGSTGADGAFNPTQSQQLQFPPSGVFNFTTVNIPANVTITFLRNANNPPVTILATGNITIAGQIGVSGRNGSNSNV